MIGIYIFLIETYPISVRQTLRTFPSNTLSDKANMLISLFQQLKILYSVTNKGFYLTFYHKKVYNKH